MTVTPDLPFGTATRDTDAVNSMTREQLPGLIAAAGKDPALLSLYGAHDNDRVVIDHRPSGWVVFYTERGNEYDLSHHSTEDAACRDVLQRLDLAW